ncbi:MAG TPA: hypothetical protein VHB69_13105 [Mycobacteriales bacterium]|nr:hypothetical protein [Mycobacteriales bacterium]
MSTQSDESARSNLSQLREAVSGLRPSRISWSDSWLLIIGSALLPLGVGLILLGWYGSAQTSLDWEQTPYLISGGLLGLGLLGVGTAMFFSYWMTRLVRSTEEAARRDREHQLRVEQLLTEISAGQRAAGRPAARAAEALVVTPGGTMLHRADCVATRGLEVTKPKSYAGLELCGICRPTPPNQRRASSRS